MGEILKKHKQIVCISPHRWEGFWFRKQHFMSRFHKKGYKIAYIDRSFSLARKPDISDREYATNSRLRIKIEEHDKDLFIVKPPRYLPFWTRPLIRKINYLYIFPRISFVLKKFGFKDYILWIYRLDHLNALKYLDYKKLVFDITDDLAAYSENNVRKFQNLIECTKTIIKKSDLVLVTAYTLLKQYQNLSSNMYLVPNGYDSKLFSNESLNTSLFQMKNVKRPIIGFVGTLFPYLDYDLIEYIVKKNPKKTFVFVGPCNCDVKRRWDEIIRYKNIIWLGKKKKEEIPAIVNKFDACINPFKIDTLSKSVSPLKVFEYLAMKKPVVSVEMESLKAEKIGKLIYFANDFNEFNKKIDYALKGTIPESEYQCLNEYSWDYLFNKTYNLVENKLM